jgi:glutamate mutase epsilon subunit
MINNTQLDEWKLKLKRIARRLDNILDMFNEDSIPIRMIIEIQEISKDLKAIQEEVFETTKGEVND